MDACDDWIAKAGRTKGIQTDGVFVPDIIDPVGILGIGRVVGVGGR
mgnify:CR=1 FL=1